MASFVGFGDKGVNPCYPFHRKYNICVADGDLDFNFCQLYLGQFDRCLRTSRGTPFKTVPLEDSKYVDMKVIDERFGFLTKQMQQKKEEETEERKADGANK